MKKLLAVLGLAAGLATACINTDQTLGEQFVATNQKYDFYSAEFDIPDVRMRPVDSLTAYSSRRITIGAVRDEDYGLYRRASAVTLVPVLKSVDFGKDPVFKRMRFRAAIDSVSVADESQLNILQNVNVYEMTEPLDSKKYFSRTPVKHGDRRITKGVPVTNGKDSLTFEFTEEFGKRFLEIKDSDLTDMKTYTKKFPGIYLTTDDPAGNGGRINMFDMEILTNAGGYLTRTDNYAVMYFNAEFDGVRKDSLLMFYFSPLEFQDLDSLITAVTLPTQYVFNTDYHETDGLAGQATDKIYVEGGSGLKPMVPAAQIKEIVENEIRRNGGDPSKAIISKATIELPFEFPEDYTTMFRYPLILSPTVRIKTDSTVTFAGLTDASVSAENQGDINRSLCNYAPDVTHHVQQLLRAGADKDLTNFDIWFLIMWYEYTTTTNTSASELASYYQQLAYYSYYNQLYGGYGYGYGSSSYGYGSSYSNYYNYIMMAQYASASATQTSVNTEMDKDRYYHAVLNGPTAPGRKPKLKFTYALPRE